VARPMQRGFAQRRSGQGIDALLECPPRGQDDRVIRGLTARRERLTRLRDEMDHAFERFLGEPFDLLETGLNRAEVWLPPIDITETDDEVTIRAEIPGIPAQNVDVAVTGHVLTISGDKEETEEHKGETYYHTERRFGTFRRVIDLPEFAEWLMTHDQTHAYAYTLKLLKTVSWFRGDPEDKPWVLKSPQHMQDLDALLNVFPNARLVCPHRDPVKVVGSSCSMAWNSLVRDNDRVTPEGVGREWLAKTERMLRKNLHDRETLSSPANQYDILYADITADWEAALQGVYDFLDMPFSGQARDAMRAWVESNSQHKHGAHKYTLEQFGLSAPQVDERLMFYRERFDIPYETGNPHTAHSPNPPSPESI